MAFGYIGKTEFYVYRGKDGVDRELNSFRQDTTIHEPVYLDLIGLGFFTGTTPGTL